MVVFYALEKGGSGAEPKFGRSTTSARRPRATASGSGDVNGDGRIDLLTPKGWFESPANPATETWPWHADWNLGATGIQILARDVDGDGLSDVVYGMGHARGLYWIKQEKGSNGDRDLEQADGDRRQALLRPHAALGRPRTATARMTSCSPASASTPTRSRTATSSLR